MSPEQADTLIGLVNQVLYVAQALVYLDFALLGGMACLGFFSFWKKIV